MKIVNDQIQQIVNGVSKTDGMTLQQVSGFRKVTVSALATGQTVIMPINNGGATNVNFIATGVVLKLNAITGTLLTPPIIRIGNNGSFNNVVALTTLTGLNTAGVTFPTSLITNLASVNINSTAISIDIQTAATGSSQYDIDVYLFGIIE